MEVIRLDNKEITKETYNDIAEKYIDSFYVNKEDLKFFDKFIECTDKGLVLDLGCGNGQASNYLTRFGYECIGYDFSEKMIDLGKKANPNLNLNVGDIENIPSLDKKATGAVYAYSLPNLTNKQAINSLKSCNKNLIVGGKVLILAFKGDTKQYEKEPFNPSKYCYINLFSEREIKKILNVSGYKVDCLDFHKEEAENSPGSIIMFILATKIKDI